MKKIDLTVFLTSEQLEHFNRHGWVIALDGSGAYRIQINAR
jgi:hypothetical protein